MGIGRPVSIQTIIRRQENLALKLLDEALDPKMGSDKVDIKLDIFDRVSKYLAVKNRIEDQEETDIDRFKQRIHGPETEAPKGRARRAQQTTPEKLHTIKSRLSGGSDSGADGDSGDPGVEIPAVAGGSG